MKIVYLHQYFRSKDDAGGTRSYEMARRLAAAGHEVHIVSSVEAHAQNRDGWAVDSMDGFTVHRISVPYSNRMSFGRRIGAFAKFALLSAGKARSLKGDVVFATSTPLTIALPGIYAIAFRKTPMVFEVRDLWPELPIAIGALKSPTIIWAARQLENLAYSRSAEIVALSPGMRDGILATGYPGARVTTIPNSADLELFGESDSALDATRWRNSLHWLEDRPLVIYCGTLGVINKVSYLAEVAAETQKLDPHVRFLVIGAGAEEELIRERARALGVLDKNFFMLPSVPKREVPVIFAAATLSTSLFAPLPEMEANSANKFFDALAAGRPVAINYGGWQEQELASSRAGIRLHPTDFEKAAEDLIDLLHSPKRLAESGIAARSLAERKFSRDALADMLRQVLERVVDGR